MKNKKEIIVQFITLLMLLMIACVCCLASCKSYEYTNNPGTAAMMQYEHMYNHQQLDSALMADELPQNYTECWVGSTYVDYETHEPITQYFYYKMNEYNEVNKIYKIELNIMELNTIDTRPDTMFRYSHSSINTVY